MQTTNNAPIDVEALDALVKVALSLPAQTVRDMVRVQKSLLDNLGIERLKMVAGGIFCFPRKGQHLLSIGTK